MEDIPEYAQYVDPQYAQQLMSESMPAEDLNPPPPRKRPEPESAPEEEASSQSQ